MPSAREVVEEHLAAFNAHDTDRMLAGFAADAVWATGRDVMRGTAELADLFDASLWELAPSLETITMIADDRAVAAELHERITVDGEQRGYRIAAFFAITGATITAAKVYREGVADID
jgi:hypothetical protein